MFAAAALGATAGRSSTKASFVQARDEQRTVVVPEDKYLINKKKEYNISITIGYLDSVLKNPKLPLIYIVNRNTKYETSITLWNGKENLTLREEDVVSNMLRNLKQLHLDDVRAEAFYPIPFVDPVTKQQFERIADAFIYLQYFLANFKTGGVYPGISNPDVIAFWTHDDICKGSVCRRVTRMLYPGGGRRNTRKSKSQRSQRKTSQRKRKSRRN